MSVSKRVISGWANRVRNMVLASQFVTRAVRCGSFLAQSALRLPLFHGMHRFIGPLLLREGCRLIQVPVNHRPRLYGRSHYNFWNRSLACDHRSVRCRLADAPAGSLSRDPDVAITEVSAGSSNRDTGSSRCTTETRRAKPCRTWSFWLAVGFLGQAFFTARFLVQWLASEKKRDSVVPVAFWWLSLLGGIALLLVCDFPP